MKELLEHIVSSIVDKPEEIKIEESKDESGEIIFNLSVAGEDMGKIIGKEGKIIKAIRTVIRVLAIKKGERVTINLEDKEPREAEKITESKPEEK